MREGMSVGVVGIDSRVNVVLEERPLRVVGRVERREIQLLWFNCSLAKDGCCYRRGDRFPFGSFNGSIDDSRGDIGSLENLFEICDGAVWNTNGVAHDLGQFVLRISV
jgi:hypothetical protein